MDEEIRALISTCELVPSENTTARLLDICSRLVDRLGEVERKLTETHAEFVRARYRIERNP